MTSPSTAEKHATRVLEEAGVDELPVPVEAIATSLGIDLQYESYDGEVSGMLYRHADGAVIGVNSMHAPTRQRFTIAHEVGHYDMHKGTPIFIDRFARVNWRNGESNQEEAQANAFAAELLMPREFVQREVERALTKRHDVTAQQLSSDLAKVFSVSAEAMQYRLANLGVLDPHQLVG